MRIPDSTRNYCMMDHHNAKFSVALYRQGDGTYYLECIGPKFFSVRNFGKGQQEAAVRCYLEFQRKYIL